MTTAGQDEGDDGQSLVERGWEALAAALEEVWAGAASLGEAAANARRLVAERLDRLRQLVDGMEVFDTVENMRLAVTPMNAEEYRESEHEGLLASVELAALLFVERGRTQAEPLPLAESAQRLAEVHRLLPEVLRLQQVAGALALQAEDESSRQAPESVTETAERTVAARPRIAARLRHSVVARELTVRNPGYVHIERQLIERLFITPRLTEILQADIGFDAADLLAIFDAVAPRATEHLVHHLRAAREHVDDQHESNDEFRALIEQAGDIGDALNRIAAAIAFSQLREIAPFDAQELATESQIPIERVRAALAALSLPVDQPTSGLIERFLAGDNPLRLHPFLRSTDADGNPRWLLVHAGLLIFAVRPFLESRLTASSYSETYSKHRGHVLEQEGISTLIRTLRPDLALRNVEYVTESGETAEADGLLLVDRVALVVEAKSRPLSTKSRTGRGAHMRRDLSDVISDAASQAQRITRILSSGAIIIRSAQQLDGAGNVVTTIRDQQLTFQHMASTLPVVLTLEDFNALTMVTADLIVSGILTDDFWPWIVNLHDLTVISDIVSLPAEFVHYLLRRRTASQATAYVAHEELDLFIRYLDTGLFVDPDEPSGANILLSHTDELDAWYAYKLGERQTPAPKPAQPMSEDLRRLLNYLDQQRPASWLIASLDLLELSEDTRNEIAGLLPKLANQSEQDHQGHSAAIPLLPPNGDRYGFVIVSTAQGSSREELATRLRGYTQLKKYAVRLKRITGFGVTAASPRPFDHYIQIESDWNQDDQLDVLVQQAGIQTDPE